jgi:hypothetical protein
MFHRKTLKILASLAIVLSTLQFLFVVYNFLSYSGDIAMFSFFNIFSWLLLLIGSIIGYQLCSTSYNLDEDDLSYLGKRIYATLGAFIVLLFISGGMAIAVAAAISATQWGLKRNIDRSRARELEREMEE